MSFLPIVHYDLDAFFASVEQKLNPKLRGKPVIVCGKGVVSTASYEARKHGVKSGMPVFQARILCPEAYFVKGNFGEYQKHSHLVYQVLKNFTPFIERSNLDEGFLDFTGFEEVYPDIIKACRKIRQEIKNNVGITVSLGISYSRVLAKIACGLAKPDGLFAISPSNKDAIVNSKPIDILPGIGPKTKVILNKINIYKVSDILASKEDLSKILGKHGTNIYLSALGQDNIWFKEREEQKSIGRSTTFPKNTNNIDYVLTMLFELCDEVFYEVVKNNLSFKSLAVTIRYTNFQDKEKCKTLFSSPSKLAHFYKIARELLFKIWDKKTVLRAVGVKTYNLTHSSNQSLFYNEQTRINNVNKTIISLREKFGKNSIKYALTQKY